MTALDPLAPVRPDATPARGLSRSLALEERREAEGARRGVLIGVLAIAAFLAWAAHAPVRETVTASGRVLPAEGL
ncbi:MAG: hypothetical protein AAGI51_04130, partial [Pseudomonadota bacterium]